MRSMLRGQYFFALLVVFGCGSDSLIPATQMVIEVDAEPGVRARAADLRILVQSSQADDLTGLEERTTLNLKPGVGDDPAYPIRVAFAPRAGHEAWTFVVTATAMAGDDDVAFARIVTSYVAGRTKYARLLIEDACMVTLNCDNDETCHEGACEDARVDPNTLPEQPITHEPTDGGIPEMCTRNADCATSQMCFTNSVCDPQNADADESGCVAGDPITCDDGIACTFDACVSTVGCVFTPVDADGDGHPDAACVDEDGEPLGDDCDDADAARFPGAFEVCDEDGVDEDCNPSTIGFKDDDGDGAIDAMCCNTNDQGATLCGLDCDDDNLAVHAKQPEFCDGIDNDCDGQIDEVENAVAWYADADMDGFGAGAAVVTSCTPQPGRSLLNNDCDDNDAEVSPRTPEVCDGVDNNCNEVVDERLIDCATSPDPADPLPINECVNGLSDCAEVATCSDLKDGFGCACPIGYGGTGRGEDGCADENECLVDNGGCDTDPMATCVNEELSPRSCMCPRGFNGSGVGADGCVDGNPCLVNNGGCDREPMATCSWRDGEDLTCTCPTGYGLSTLDATQCVDINECDTNNGGCGDSAFYRCDNNEGAAPTCTELDRCAIANGGCDQNPRALCAQDGATITCTCPSGYTTSNGGVTCTDINECTANTDNCDDDPDACVNEAGSFRCMCPDGYTTTDGGRTCTDINECATNNGGCSTSPMVTCTNTPGSRTCGACPSGYTGTGVGNCVDVNECATNNGGCSTSPMVTCTNTPGSRTCGACPTGYNGNGMTCTDINECATNNGGCSTSPMVTCTNTPGGRTCGACPSGYTGTGVGNCVDVNECTTNNGGCSTSPMVTCTNTPGSRTCGACPSGYNGNGVTCTDINECETNNGGCGPAAGARCINNDGAAPTCQDINPCLLNNGGCGPASTWRCVDDHPFDLPSCIDITPIGYPNDLGGMTTINSGTLLAIPVTVSTARTITTIGLYGGTPGRVISMGVYTDVSGPSMLLARAENNALGSFGQVEFPAVAAVAGGLTLAPGTYWIAALVDGSVAVSAGAPSITRRFVARGGTTMPVTVTGTSAQSGNALSFFIRP